MFQNAISNFKKLILLQKGPYVIFAYNGKRSILFTLKKLDGRHAKNIYHGDYLRDFGLLEGYLVSPIKEAMKIYTRMCHKQDTARLRA